MDSVLRRDRLDHPLLPVRFGKPLSKVGAPRRLFGLHSTRCKDFGTPARDLQEKPLTRSLDQLASGRLGSRYRKGYLDQARMHFHRETNPTPKSPGKLARTPSAPPALWTNPLTKKSRALKIPENRRDSSRVLFHVINRNIVITAVIIATHAPGVFDNEVSAPAP